MSYIGNEPVISAIRTVSEFTATAGQTTFNPSGGYTVGFIDVFRNGVQLQSTDFTATNGTTVVLAIAANAGDAIRCIAWGVFSTTAPVTLDSLSDVVITSPATSQVLNYNGTNWVNSTPSGGGQFFGSATVKAIAYNANTIGENVTVTAGNNGLSAGPITISSGFGVTVETGAVWVIV